MNEENFLKNLKFIPQVTLLSVPKEFFKICIDLLLKKIVCEQKACSNENLCNNCQKLKDGNYFDLRWYKFDKSNIMKKHDVFTIIDTLSYQSIENNNPRICVVEQIECSSLEANNSFLKFLENLPGNTFLIFASANIAKVLPTIKSRCQIINLLDTNSKLNEELIVNDLELVKDLINKFIDIDDNDFNESFFLIKELSNLKEKIDLFFQFLLILVQAKITSSSFFSSELNNIVKSWKNNDQLFLINFVEILTETINKFNNVKNLNLNLLLNNFFINIYQGHK